MFDKVCTHLGWNCQQCCFSYLDVTNKKCKLGSLLGNAEISPEATGSLQKVLRLKFAPCFILHTDWGHVFFLHLLTGFPLFPFLQAGSSSLKWDLSQSRVPSSSWKERRDRKVKLTSPSLICRRHYQAFSSTQWNVVKTLQVKTCTGQFWDILIP